MKKAFLAIVLIAAIAMIGCAKKGNKTSVTKTPAGKTVTTVTSPQGRVVSRTTK
jgi:hypothetical protein